MTQVLMRSSEMKRKSFQSEALHIPFRMLQVKHQVLVMARRVRVLPTSASWSPEIPETFTMQLKARKETNIILTEKGRAEMLAGGLFF